MILYLCSCGKLLKTKQTRTQHISYNRSHTTRNMVCQLENILEGPKEWIKIYLLMENIRLDLPRTLLGNRSCCRRVRKYLNQFRHNTPIWRKRLLELQKGPRTRI